MVPRDGGTRQEERLLMTTEATDDHRGYCLQGLLAPGAAGQVSLVHYTVRATENLEQPGDAPLERTGRL